MNGFLLIDKPAGPSSFAVVRRVRKVTAERRVGHSGTLDPAATGLLVVALGKATRLLPFLTVDPKIYRFGIQFGTETDTLDATGQVTLSGGAIPGVDEVRGILARFVGDQQQQPPRYSSLKVNGVRAYALARQERDFELKPRTIHVHTLTLDSYDESRGEALLTVSCTSGTYVRSLACDIARALNTYGHASLVRRERVGSFTVEKALSLDAVVGDLSARVVSVGAAFHDRPAVTLAEPNVADVKQGRAVRVPDLAHTAGPIFGYDRNGELRAVLELRSTGELQPIRVF